MGGASEISMTRKKPDAVTPGSKDQTPASSRTKTSTYTGMSGWTSAAPASQRIAPKYRLLIALATANNAANAEIDLGFRYWSMMSSAVPATPMVSRPATSATAH